MSELKNEFENMNFGTENSLEALFGSFSAPPVDLGDAGVPPTAEDAETTSKANQEIVSEAPQAEEATPQAPTQMPQGKPEAAAAQEDPAPQSTQTTGQVIDLFGAVAESNADALLAKLAGKPPVFEYGSITDEISDPTITFEQLRIKMAADCPELETRAHVSWSVSYAGITERISDAEASIFEVKSKIEKGKKFKENVKKLKPKDKEPVCAVKPTVTAQKKGVLPFPPYKGMFISTEEAAQSDKAIAYIPAQDGKVYEMRRNEIGMFIAPSQRIAELEDIRAGFQMSLPRLPAPLIAQIIAFFRRVCVEYSRDLEALVNVLWDRQMCEYVLHVPPQKIDAMSVKTDLSQQPDPTRYLHVMDVHSHNTMSARFSKVDDRDEQATRLYMVIGRLDRYYPEIRCRFACGGRHMEIPAEQICERADVPFSPEWLAAVHEGGLKEAA